VNTVSEIRVRLIEDERGVIIIEAAFSFILLIFLFLGAVTLSFVIRDCYNIQKVAREGAREACITGSVESGYNKALSSAWLYGLDPDRLTIKFDNQHTGNRNLITCDVTYRINLFSRTFPQLVGGDSLFDFDVHSKATFGWWDFS
jgi:Flp pilus assembly protein TadG